MATTTTSMFQDISITTAWILMIIVIIAVATPGIGLLYYLHGLFPAFPSMLTPLAITFFVCQATIAMAFSLFAILIFSDVVYPIVIYSFAQIISRQALAKEPPPNMQYYLPHDETLNGTINDSACEERPKDE